MSNPGVAPLNTATAVGQFRVRYGDTEYVPLSPVVAGEGDYTELSDSEIQLFLSVSRDSVPRAIADYYGTLAGLAAKKSMAVKDYDLSVDLKNQYKSLLETAAWWDARADAEDEFDGSAEILDIWDAPNQPEYDYPIEGMPGLRAF